MQLHSFRPGICRVFPLGRIYEDGKLDYFLQAEGCVKQERSKVKVGKWLDTPDLKRNQKYLINWACVPQENRRNPRCHGR